MKPLVRLIYFSSAVREMTLADMQEILEVARFNNQKNGLCGMLCYDNQFFLQVLEGSRENVNELLFKIAEDPRHADLVIASYDYIEKTTFDSWDMGYSGSSPHLEKVLAKLNQTQFDPNELPPQHLHAILKQMSSNQESI